MDMHDWEIEGTLAHAEREAIIAALIFCDHCRSAAAARLGVGRSTLYRLMVAYKIENSRRKRLAFPPPFKPQKNSKSRARSGATRELSCATQIVNSGAAINESKIILQEGIWLLVPA